MRPIPAIFLRHVLRDVGYSTAGVAAVLLVLLLAYQLSSVLGRAADGQIPASLVFELVSLSARNNIVIVLPMAVVLGAVLGLGRLYHDSEMAAAQACGVDTRVLYAAVGSVTVVAALLSAWIAFYDGPDATRRAIQIRTEARRTAVTRGLTPGQFRTVGTGATLYFRDRDAGGMLRDVFVQRRISHPGAADNGEVEIVLADRAHYAVSDDSNYYTITLFNGESHAGVPGKGAWRSLKFREQTVRLATPEATAPNQPRVDVLPTSALRASSDPRFSSELHWRTATVLSTLALGFMAVPLARLRPRQGRYARVVWAVLLYALYMALLVMGRSMLERGGTPLWLGLWWAHALALLLGAAFVFMPRFSDWRARQRVVLAGIHPAS